MARTELISLCQWLRNNSSGIYRQAAEAADEIERLAALLSKMCEALAKQHDTADDAWGKAKRERHYCDASSALDSIRQSTAAALDEYDRLMAG